MGAGQPLLQIMGEFQNHIGLKRHLLFLLVGQVIAGIDGPFLAGVGVADVKEGEAGFFDQHHAPGKAKAFLGPQDAAWVQPMTQRKEDLQDEEQPQQGEDKAFGSGRLGGMVIGFRRI